MSCSSSPAGRRPRVLNRGRLLVFLLLGTVASLVACGGGGGGGLPGVVTTVPTWISASWSGGAMGPPNDYRAIEATEWQGLICPASHLDLDYNGVTLHYVNNCTIPVTYAICVAKGTLQGANVCSPDPLNTSTSNLIFRVLTPGALGDYLNASGNLGVNIFYCSDKAQIIGGPVRCIQTP